MRSLNSSTPDYVIKPMKLETKLDKVHRSVISNVYLQLFTAFTRILLGIGFIYPSLPKIMNRPFTMLPTSDPVGHYFDALYQTGFYYQFIGWSQLSGAILLLIPRTSHIGALMFFPIILNIAVLTNSVGFKGTWLVTILMLLACIYLVCWDYDRWKPILFGGERFAPATLKNELVLIPVLFAIGGASFFAILAWFNVGNIYFEHFRLLSMLTILGLVFGFAVALHHKYMRLSNSDK